MGQRENECKAVFSLQAAFLQEVKGNRISAYLTLTVKQSSSCNTNSSNV